MNVLKIVVDEVPGTCHDCELIQNYVNCESDCSILHQVASFRSRRFDCPLVVEEVCEWNQIEHDNYSATYLLGCTAKRMALGYSGSLIYVYCPNCGKPIKYVEVE